MFYESVLVIFAKSYKSSPKTSEREVKVHFTFTVEKKVRKTIFIRTTGHDKKVLHSCFKLLGEWSAFICNDNFKMKNIANSDNNLDW